MTDKELLQQALDALISIWNCDKTTRQVEAIQAIKARLAQPEETVNGWPLYSGLPQPEQEPTAYLCENAVGHKYFRWKKPSSEYKPIALYTAHASPKRIWQGLTDEEILQIRAEWEVRDYRLSELCRAIEAKLKEKNNG